LALIKLEIIQACPFNVEHTKNRQTLIEKNNYEPLRQLSRQEANHNAVKGRIFDNMAL